MARRLLPVCPNDVTERALMRNTMLLAFDDKSMDLGAHGRTNRHQPERDNQGALRAGRHRRGSKHKLRR